MNPLEQIKKGIETDNMQLVSEAYKTLTGENVEVVSRTINYALIEEAIELLSNCMLETPIIEEEKPKPIVTKQKKGRPAKKKIIKVSENDLPDEIVEIKPKKGLKIGDKSTINLKTSKTVFPMEGLVDEKIVEQNEQINANIRANVPRIPRPEAEFIVCPNPKCKKKLRLESVMTKYVADDKTYTECRCPHCRKEFQA